jgi:predicted  nucleic acid-binding Zn-ribbon protein
MSTPPTESKPSPWLTLAVTLAVTLAGLAGQWGTLGADVRNLERRVATAESELARVSTAQSTAAAQSARIEERLDGVTRELARLARAVERLSDAPTPPVSARAVP